MQLVRPVQLVAGDDGGLARRQELRSVQKEMSKVTFRTKRMVCGACSALNLRNVRRFRTWESLRDHLIGYHDIDPREVPE